MSSTSLTDSVPVAGKSWNPKVACGIALLNSIGTFGGFVAPLTVGLLKQQTGSYAAPFTVVALVMLGCAAVTLSFGRAITAQAAHPVAAV